MNDSITIVESKKSKHSKENEFFVSCNDFRGRIYVKDVIYSVDEENDVFHVKKRWFIDIAFFNESFKHSGKVNVGYADVKEALAQFSKVVEEQSFKD
jgi:prepilin-type processing-associated H-X9-DG protein